MYDKMTLANILFPHISWRKTWQSRTTRSHKFSHHDNSSPASTEPRAEHLRQQISPATILGYDDNEAEIGGKLAKSQPKTQIQPWKVERSSSSTPVRSDNWMQIWSIELVGRKHRQSHGKHLWSTHRRCIWSTWQGRKEKETVDDKWHSGAIWQQKKPQEKKALAMQMYSTGKEIKKWEEKWSRQKKNWITDWWQEIGHHRRLPSELRTHISDGGTIPEEVTVNTTINLAKSQCTMKRTNNKNKEQLVCIL